MPFLMPGLNEGLPLRFDGYVGWLVVRSRKAGAGTTTTR